MSVTPKDIQRAIEIVEWSRSTHIKWRDYLVKFGHLSDVKAEAEIVGDIEYQVSRIERYDHVLRVLNYAKAEATQSSNSETNKAS